jgi:flagellar M-ring protein FliF
VENFVSLFQRLGLVRVGLMAAVALGLLGFFGFFANKLSQPPMGLLYGDLAQNDAGQIVAKLEAQNVPFELRAGGSQVWVPQDRALRLRMSMAEQGLPRGGTIGYEVFDQSSALGATSFVQNLNLVRALEGELARTIGSLGPVSGARVHLSIPRRDVFSRERLEPSASVVLKLRETGRLPRNHVGAIQSLVASAVPGMKPTRVSIVDDRGTLLARGTGDGEDGSGVSSASGADERRLEMEQRLSRKIEEQLERAVGPGRVRAEVSLEMDFDRIVTNSESFDPEGQVIRSQQTVSENSDSTESSGNQGVTVANNIPDGDAAGGGNQNRSRTTRQEETINYEVTKRVTSHVREVGSVKRLSASIIVDGITTIGADGKPSYQARNPEQIEQLRLAARSAVGFNERRGDTLELINMPFAAPDGFAAGGAVAGGAEPGMFDLSRAEILRITELAILFIVAILVILLVARPLIGAIGRAATMRVVGPGMAALPESGAMPAALAAPAAGTALAVAAGVAQNPASQIDLDSIDGRMGASSMKKIGEIVDKHPDETVAILRNWIYQEAG